MVVSRPLKAGDLVEIGVVDRLEHGRQRLGSAADIDHDIVLIERLAEKSDIDDESCAMRVLGRAKKFTGQAVRDHDVVADFESVQQDLLGVSIADRGCDARRARSEQTRQGRRQILEG